MELRCCRNQNDGKICYGLVNIIADEQSKLGTKYSVPQIALFKGIIEAIAQDDTAHGSISTITALNLRLENQVQYGVDTQSQGSLEVPAAIRNFSMSQKERTIDELVENKWLSQTPDGDIGLGFRSYLDLRSWFHNMGIPSCEVCNEGGVKAKVCPSEGCNVRIHEYCLKKKRPQKGGKIVCSSCGIEWPYGIPKSEVPDEEDVQASQRETQRLTGLKKKRNRVSGNVGVETESDSAQGSQAAGRVTRSTRFSGRPR
ncbi:Non-structural maintenance of chromosomes element 1 homolog [Linum perenne]